MPVRYDQDTRVSAIRPMRERAGPGVFGHSPAGPRSAASLLVPATPGARAPAALGRRLPPPASSRDL
jgi:hypothetical protein